MEQEDPTPAIIAAALDAERTCELCKTTLGVFVSALGAEAGNLALKVLAPGGVYLGGGIPPRIISTLEGRGFMVGVVHKARFSDLVTRIPVHVMLNPEIAPIGAASHGPELTRERHRT